jgi:hypothetical protein
MRLTAGGVVSAVGARKCGSQTAPIWLWRDEGQALEPRESRGRRQRSVEHSGEKRWRNRFLTVALKGLAAVLGHIGPTHERFVQETAGSLDRASDMITITPQTGTHSAWADSSDPCPALAGRIDFPGQIIGASVQLLGRLGTRPSGVSLRLDERVQDDDAFELALVSETGDTLMVLGRFDDEDVVAVWRALGAETGLPLVTQSEDGALQQPYPQVGRVPL